MHNLATALPVLAELLWTLVATCKPSYLGIQLGVRPSSASTCETDFFSVSASAAVAFPLMAPTCSVLGETRGVALWTSGIVCRRAPDGLHLPA